MKAFIKRQGKRRDVITDGVLDGIERTKTEFVFSFRGHTQYGKLPSRVDMAMSPDELGNLLKGWGVVDLIRGIK